MLSCLFLLLLRRCGRAFLSPIEAGTTDVPGHRRWNNASLKRPLSLAHFVSPVEAVFSFVAFSLHFSLPLCCNIVGVDVIFIFIIFFVSQELGVR